MKHLRQSILDTWVKQAGLIERCLFLKILHSGRPEKITGGVIGLILECEVVMMIQLVEPTLEDYCDDGTCH